MLNNETWEKLKEFLEENKIPYQLELACANSEQYIYNITLPYLVVDLE